MPPLTQQCPHRGCILGDRHAETLPACGSYLTGNRLARAQAGSIEPLGTRVRGMHHGRIALARRAGEKADDSSSTISATGRCCLRSDSRMCLMARRWQVLLVTAVGVFMTFLDVTIVNIAFPDIRASFPDSSLAQLSWILNAYAIVFAAALVPAGRLADRFGRRRFFFGGLLLFLGASVVCGAAASVDVLIGARIVQALGGAMLVPASLALVLPEFPLERRATATALWGATGAVAAAAGPSLGGVLVEWQGWRSVFYVNLLIGLPALLPARRLLRESREPQAALPDLLGAGSPRRRSGRARARDRRGSGLGVVVASRGRRLRRERDAARRCRLALEPTSLACDRALALPGAFVRRRERRRVRVRARLLRAPAVQRPLPDRSLGILDPRGRSGFDARPACGRGRGTDRRATVRSLRPARRRVPGGLLFAAGAAPVCAPHRRATLVRQSSSCRRRS